MMDKKERDKILRENSKILYAKAVRDLIIENLINLNEITLTENYEDYRSKKEAKKVLKRIFSHLSITEKEIKESNKKQYE